MVSDSDQSALITERKHYFQATIANETSSSGNQNCQHHTPQTANSTAQ
jgi:hypothetical protein